MDFVKSLSGISGTLPIAGNAAPGIKTSTGTIMGGASSLPGSDNSSKTDILPTVAATVLGAGAGAAVKGATDVGTKSIAKGAIEAGAEVAGKNIAQGATESAIPKGAPEAKPVEPPNKPITKDTAKQVAEMKAQNPELTSKQALEEIRVKEPTPALEPPKAPVGEPVKVASTAPAEAVAGAPEKKGVKAALSDIKAAVSKRIGGQVERMAGLGAKALPFGIGTAIGGIFGAMRWWEGDTKGAIAEVGLGAASAFPVAGTAIAIAGQTAMMGRDIYNEVYKDDKNQFPFDDDLINDPSMVGQRMLDIKDMLQQEITKAAEANQASREETTAAMEGAGRKLGGAVAQQPAKVGGGMTATGAITANATNAEKKAFIEDKTRGKMTFPEWKAKKDAANAATDPSTAPAGTPAMTTPDAGLPQAAGPPDPGSQGSGDGVLAEGQNTDPKTKPIGAPESTGAAPSAAPAPPETPKPEASNKPIVVNNEQTTNSDSSSGGEALSTPNFPMTAQNDMLTQYFQKQLLKEHN
jgi:hypothetical protein